VNAGPDKMIHSFPAYVSGTFYIRGFHLVIYYPVRPGGSYKLVKMVCFFGKRLQIPFGLLSHNANVMQ